MPQTIDEYPAGLYHHDRCGHRLKFYLYLTKVPENGHPLRVALGSHTHLYFASHDMETSRFGDTYVERTWKIASVVGDEVRANRARRKLLAAWRDAAAEQLALPAASADAVGPRTSRRCTVAGRRLRLRHEYDPQGGWH